MFDGRGFEAAEQMVDDWQEGFERRAAQARELAARMEGLRATGRSPDGLVEVTVGRAGELTGLHLDEDIRRQPASTTEREILAAVSAARTALAEKVRHAVDDTLGADTESGRAILAGYEADRPE
ncbi:YbaB/EbfC family nucleoid-associated protein [Actinoplanes sp. NPDC049596]|uniref:YbaB/EbfC family nucleoid-associated protein n=1 Tax=unclassified Actinoplanes TaxID=2626549 RepID=UPI00341B795A